MHRFQRIKKPVTDIISLGIVARLLNILKGFLLAYYISKEYTMDTYAFAFASLTLSVLIIADALILSLIPTLQREEIQNGKKGKIRLTNDMLHLIIGLSLVLIIVTYILTPKITNILAKGFEVQDFQEIIGYIRLASPLIILHFIRAIYGGYLQSEHKFRAGAKSGVANSLIYIIYLLIFRGRFGLKGLLLAGLFAVAAQIIIMIQGSVMAGYSYQFTFNFKNKALKDIFLYLVPISLFIAISELNSRLTNSSISKLNENVVVGMENAGKIIEPVTGLLIMAIITAIYPILSENFNKGQVSEFKANMKFVIKLISLIIFPILLILIIFAGPLTGLVYRNSKLDGQTLFYSVQFLRISAVGLIGNALLPLIVRGYYAINNTRRPIILAGIIIGLNLLFNKIFVDFTGVYGPTLGGIISVLIVGLYGLYDLNHRINLLGNKNK